MEGGHLGLPSTGIPCSDRVALIAYCITHNRDNVTVYKEKCYSLQLGNYKHIVIATEASPSSDRAGSTAYLMTHNQDNITVFTIVGSIASSV